MDKDNFTAAKGQAGSENVSLRSAAADVIKNLARSAKRAAKKDTSAPERPEAAAPSKAASAAAAEAPAATPARSGRARSVSSQSNFGSGNRRSTTRTVNRPRTDERKLNTAGGKEGREPAAKKEPSAGRQKLAIIPLGGLGEVGKNMTAFKFGNNIIVVDSGMTFPDEEQLGIDLVIPDYSYLLENKSMVRGIFVTHGHEDHIGALPYVMKDLKVPVYGSRLTLGLLRGKLKEHQRQ